MHLTTNTRIALLISTMVNAVVFGIGAITVLSVPQLYENAKFWLPVVIVTSFAVAPFIAAYLAPRLRSRQWHRRQQLRD